jgi:hypothetical protein
MFPSTQRSCHFRLLFCSNISAPVAVHLLKKSIKKRGNSEFYFLAGHPIHWCGVIITQDHGKPISAKNSLLPRTKNHHTSHLYRYGVMA